MSLFCNPWLSFLHSSKWTPKTEICVDSVLINNLGCQEIALVQWFPTFCGHDPKPAVVCGTQFMKENVKKQNKKNHWNLMKIKLILF